MITRGGEGYCLSKYWTISNDSDTTTPVDWSWMNGTVYQGSLLELGSLRRLAYVNGAISPIGLDRGGLRANLLRDWLDLVEFDPHGLVRQLLVVK